MKKLKLFFALFAMLALGVTNAWGAEETVSWTATTNSLGSAISKVNGTATGTIKTGDFVWNYTRTLTSLKSGKTDYVQMSNGYMQCGSSNAINSLKFQTSNIPGTIKSVAVNCASYQGKHNISITVGGTTYLAKTAVPTWSSNNGGVKTGTGTSSGEIIISFTDGTRALYIKSITVVYEETSGSGGEEPVLSSIAVSGDLTNKTYEEGDELDLAGLTVNATYDDASTKVVTNDVEWSYTPNPLTKGTTSATVIATYEDKTATTTITGLTVNEHIITPGEYYITLNNVFFSTTAGTNISSFPTSAKQDDITVTLNGSGTKTRTDAANVRMYSGNTLTFSVPVGYLITSITFTEPSSSTQWDEKITVNPGDYDETNKSWSGLAQDVVFTFGAQNRIAKAIVTYVADVKSTLTIETPQNGTISVKNGTTEVTSGTQLPAGTSLVVTPTPKAGYVFESLTVNSSAVELTDGTYTFNMPAADVTIAATFKENEKPAATLTLSKNGVTEDITGYKQDDVVTLPSITSDCVKEFVGWSADDECATEPEYKAGDEYTLASTTQTLYAVYATVGGGDEATAANTLSSNGWANESKHTSLQIDANVKAAVTGGGNTGKYYTSGTNWRLYQNEDAKITISTSLGELKSVKFTFTNSNTGTLLYNGTKLTSETAVSVSGTSAIFTVGNSTASVTNGQIRISKIEVVYTGGVSYSNYSTTCAAAPKAEVDPTTVSATAAGAEGKVTVTYKNVNTANVSVALYNDEACTEAFTDGWLTAALDGDKKNVTYTVTENTTYAERKAYIKLTAPETTGATEPAVVVIPVTQAAKDKVFASLEELVAADLTAGDEVTVTLNNDVIKEFYIYSSKRCGVVFDVQKDGKDIKIYFNNQTTIVDWAVGGKLSGTLTNVKWTTYSSAWQLAPANTWAWANLTYTEPKAVSTVVVSGAPTKTTYVDGEAFDPAGLTVTVNYNDATNEVNPTGVTYAVTPATLVKGQTSVSVTATFNSVSSAAYEVTGLTVNDIPTKTVAEFIAVGGTRCYLEGIVSGLTEGNSMKYGNFDLTDASGKIYVYGCLNAAGESKKFAELGVKNGDKIKVIADEYELYNGTTEEAKNVQYVSHVSAAFITIADITMEVGETKTIAATIVPAEAEVTYTIKENAANAISLSDKTITALAEGTATITATVAEGADYLANSVDFTVKVTPKSEKTNVVILAEYNDTWYALVAAKGSANNTLGAVKVTYVNGVILDFDGDKASITWERAIVGNKATFKNGTNYMKGATGDTDLTLETSAFEWDVVDGKYLVENKRTFLYNKAGYFKNYDAKSNAGKSDYSAWPVVTAVEFMKSVDTPSVEKGIFSVADDKFVQFSTGNLQYEVGTNTWSFASEQYDYVGEANINIGDPNYEGKIDMFGWSTDDENNNYGVNPNNVNELYDGTFQDWGTLVNEADWYTLSADEWKYLLNTRANAANLKQIAKVGSVVGIMLFPDAWTMPADVNVAAAYDDYFKVNIYNYTSEQWQKLEAVGAVFLPAAGRRAGGYGNMINYDQQVETRDEYLVNGGFYRWQDNTNIYCYYWTSTINESTKDVSYLHNIQALGGDKYTIGTGAVWGEKGRYGQSVRLVKAITPNYKREVRQGYYGTICLENGGQMIGAARFELSYYNEAQGLLYMDEADATMVAGNPYIFLPNEGANTLYVFYDETTPATEAGTVNGLVGSYTKEPLAVDATNPNYILKDNKIKKVVGTGVSVGANKAYIKLGDVDKNEPALVPGRRRVAIGQAPQVATGMESVDASAQPVKMIIDGQLYILRGEKMYDAQGKLVK